MPPAAEDHGVTVRLDELLKKRGITAAQLSERTGITQANLSNLRNGQVTAIRFSTIAALCRELDCGAGELITVAPLG